MNNVVDEVLNTSATQNKVKYKITYSDNTSDIAEIDLYTPVTTTGTPINKALFDSIKADLTTLTNTKENITNKTNALNSSSTTTQYPNAKVVYDNLATKLNISSKATTAQAQAGTDDTNYMTALKVVQAITKQGENKLLANYIKTGVVETIASTDTVATFDNTSKMLLITIDLYGSNSGTYQNKVTIGNVVFDIGNIGRCRVFALYDRRTNLLFSATRNALNSDTAETKIASVTATSITCTHKLGNAGHYSKVTVQELF